MRFSVRLLVSFLAVGLFSVSLLGILFIGLFVRRTNEEVASRLLRGREAVLNQIEEISGRAVIQAEGIKDRPEIKTALAEVEKEVFLKELMGTKARTDLDILEIIDPYGVGRLSLAQEIRWGDDHREDPLFRKALEGSAAVGLLRRERLGPYILVSLPLREGGKVVGVLQAGYFFDERLLSEIKRLTKMDLTLYQPTGESLTTLVDEEGHYYSPEFLAKEKRSRCDEEAGRSSQDFEFGGHRYRSVYSTLCQTLKFLGPVTVAEEKRDDVVLADLLLSLPIDDVLAARAATLRLLILYLLLVVLAAATFSLLISRSIGKRLGNLSRVAGKVSKGDFKVKAEEGSNDEFGLLAKAFNEMVTELKSAFSQLEKDSRLLLRRDLDLVMLTQKLDERNAELRKTIATLEAANRRNTVLLGSIGDGVMAVDQEGRVILFNEALSRLTGCRPSEAVAERFDRLLHLNEENGLPVTFTYLKRHVKKAGGPLRLRDVVLDRKEGGKSFVYLVVTPIESPLEELRGLMVVFHDTSKERELERMKLDFVSMAVHELRTPISIIRGYLSFLQEGIEGFGRDEQEFLNRAIIGSANLNNLVENLLNVARIEQGKLEIQAQPSSLEEVVLKVVEEFRPLAESKGLKLIYSPPKRPLPKVLVDVFRIEVVLRNLLSNAISYTPRGEVEVSFAREGDVVITSVRDTGQGIPTEAMPHLFTKFFRVQGELQSGSKGTGLGLYISKNIVQAHGGKISAESELGVGTTVSFSLPLAK